MLKARSNKLIILGLSDENLTRLKGGEPIKFKMKDLQIPKGVELSELDFYIFNGKDEQAMAKMLPSTNPLNIN